MSEVDKIDSCSKCVISWTVLEFQLKACSISLAVLPFGPAYVMAMATYMLAGE